MNLMDKEIIMNIESYRIKYGWTSEEIIAIKKCCGIVEEKKTLNISGVHNGKGFYFEEDVKDFIENINIDLNNIPRQLSDKVIMIPLGKATNAINKRAGERLI